MKMTLKQWLDNGWLRQHQTTAKEIENLFQIVDRDSDELIDFAKSFKEEVLEYLKNSHPDLLGTR